MTNSPPPDDYLRAIDQSAFAPRKTGRSRPGGGRGRGPDRKTLQLCRQVADTLNYVLTGECDDDLLRNLYVVRVDPAPDASQMMVTVAPMDPADLDRVDEILVHLTHATKRLRSEVAASIHRRKTPSLLFRVISPAAAADGSAEPEPVEED